jgi:hypothetical protein
VQVRIVGGWLVHNAGYLSLFALPRAPLRSVRTNSYFIIIAEISTRRPMKTQAGVIST